jgi:hypothetical protein
MNYLSSLRRRGQGMTEYIIIVGLVGLLLSIAVQRYKTQIEVTIIGNENSLTNHVDNQIDAQANNSSGKKPKHN